MNESPAVECGDVWYAYRRGDAVLRGVSLNVAGGEFVAVLGHSGAGKTTLIKVLAGLLRADAGRVRLLGIDITRRTPHDLRSRVGYIPQQLGLVRSATALDNVLLGALGRQRGPMPLLGFFPAGEVKEARSWLERMGIPEKADEPAFRLSGGERQRVAIARTMLQRPSIVFADEFVSDLDLPRAAEVLALMRSISDSEGITFVVNMHNLPLVREFSDRAILLAGGVVAQTDTPSALSARELGEPQRC